jgi:hypothetical protein
MPEQHRLVLRDKDGAEEHGRGMIDAEKASTATLVERNERLYMYHHMRVEQGVITLFYHECKMLPFIITEW